MRYNFDMHCECQALDQVEIQVHQNISGGRYGALQISQFWLTTLLDTKM